MEISEEKLKSLMAAAAEIGATRALVAVGDISPQIKLSDAYRLYGRSRIDLLISKGKITKIASAETGTKRLDRQELLNYFTTEVYAS